MNKRDTSRVEERLSEAADTPTDLTKKIVSVMFAIANPGKTSTIKS